MMVEIFIKVIDLYFLKYFFKEWEIDNIVIV